MDQTRGGPSHPTDPVRCGLYRTTKPIGDSVSEGVLVYFHNHGEPGPGVYPVARWSHNKAVFAKKGILLPEPGYARTLHPLRPEGFYQVVTPFYCCEKQCRRFDTSSLLQLGYDGSGQSILFTPVWTLDGLKLPDKGTKVTEEKLQQLSPLKVPYSFEEDEPSSGLVAPEEPGHEHTIH